MKEEIINKKVNDLIDNFDSYISYFKKDNPFSGPSEYFYMNKIIKTIKTRDDGKIFCTDFIELVYATLASWGMHRMGPDNKGAKMNDFGAFKDCIMKNKELFIELSPLKLEEVKLDVESIEKLNKIYSYLGPLMRSNSKLVATTKVMHFFLPDLVPPMDREYTMKFFNIILPTIKSSNDHKNIEKEVEIFNFVLLKMQDICKNVDCKKFIDNLFSPSVPKVLDNAIVGYIRKHK